MNIVNSSRFLGIYFAVFHNYPSSSHESTTQLISMESLMHACAIPKTSCTHERKLRLGPLWFQISLESPAWCWSAVEWHASMSVILMSHMDQLPWCYSHCSLIWLVPCHTGHATQPITDGTRGCFMISIHWW